MSLPHDDYYHTLFWYGFWLGRVRFQTLANRKTIQWCAPEPHKPSSSTVHPSSFTSPVLLIIYHSYLERKYPLLSRRDAPKSRSLSWDKSERERILSWILGYKVRVYFSNYCAAGATFRDCQGSETSDGGALYYCCTRMGPQGGGSRRLLTISVDCCVRRRVDTHHGALSDDTSIGRSVRRR